MNERYAFKVLEARWRSVWEGMKLYYTDEEPGKPKFYCLDFFPYPSGDGLSVGHCRNYVPTCVYSRFKKAQGYNVLHPMGWDAFGLPAENFAIQQNVHPSVTTQRNTDTYRRQMKLVECCYDWEREVNSTHPDYYRWTQWFFLLLFKRGLAYQAMGSQWWCPECKTILANEQVESGLCWRCESEVTRKDLKQWYFKITEYADRLLDDLETIHWPEPIKIMQRNWIGKSYGCDVYFTVEAGGKVHPLPVFTTRIDTIYGVTFMAIAPEHPLAAVLTKPERKAEVQDYIEKAKRKTEIDRMSAEKEKTGVFTGSYAANPLSGEKVPVWIGDYVLLTYGTGAVMGVPAHDTRDFAFAKKYGLEIREVIRPKDASAGPGGEMAEAFVDYGLMVNSGKYDGLTSEEGIENLIQDMEKAGTGKRRITYRLRDWLISRQRYWGAPIPIIHCEKCGPVAVPEDRLPVLLPDLQDFQPTGTGKSPLSKVESFVNTTCPQCGGPGERETDTMDGFACSSWYFLRFTSPWARDFPCDPDKMRYWMPVDLYVGGAEHAVMHLLYARFWTKVMHDAGLVPFQEPFATLKNQGMLLGEDGQKMSKSKGNVITPDEVVERYGVDALRLYILFIGPFEAELKWDEQGIRGVYRFLGRVWTLVISGIGPAKGETDEGEFRRWMHKTIRKVTRDIEGFQFNTAVAALMEWLNYFQDQQGKVPAALWKEALEAMVRLLSPMAPFIAEELWQEGLGHRGESVHTLPWMDWDEAAIQEAMVTIVVQVNGKVRDRLLLPADASEGEVREAALASERVKKFVGEKTIRNVVVVPGKLVSVVAG